MKKFLSLIYLFFLLPSLTLLSADPSNTDQEFYDLAFCQKGIKKSYYNQNALKLFALVPPELRDLPYATYPTDINYNTFRFNFNKRFNVFPQAIIAPRTPEEAIYVLNALKKYNLQFSIRSGGHCFESGSLSPGYIFDLRNFNTILPDVEREEVYIGAGCLLTDVIQTLGALNYVIPTGTCPTVGVTGLTLGGGIGLLVRSYGLTCDSVKSITLLTADEQIIEVNENSHSDLFWALKGGGNGSYGIVLGFTFKMHYAPIVTFYELLFEWNPREAERIIRAWQKWMLDLPSSISSSLRLDYREGILGIKVIGLKVGSVPFTEWQEAFERFNPVVKTYTAPYVDTVQYWATQPSYPFNKIKSKILLEPLSRKVIHKIVNYLEYLKNERKPNLRVFLNFDGFGGVVPNFDNSFPFKNAFGWWYQAIYWPLQSQTCEALELINMIYHETSRDISRYSYANATDYELGKRYLKAYYRQNVDRLVTIKTQYDPLNLFHWKQSIPVCR